MKADFAPRRQARKPSLTPMIDVVFLLLVFFMLASRFGVDQLVPLNISGGSAPYSGPPRLVEIGPDTLRLNGIDMAEDTLPDAVADLTDSGDDIVVLRPDEQADLQRVVAIIETLTAAGFDRLVLVE